VSARSSAPSGWSTEAIDVPQRQAQRRSASRAPGDFLGESPVELRIHPHARRAETADQATQYLLGRMPAQL
jgi:hypothetical protein